MSWCRRQSKLYFIGGSLYRFVRSIGPCSGKAVLGTGD